MPDPISWSEAAPYFAAFALLGYLLGAIPFGLLITKAVGLGDIRKVGSGNIGATNVLRTGNKGAAAATLLLDGGKALAAVLICEQYGGPDGAVIGGVFAFLGHLFPVWLKFNGGKGVACFFGIAFGAFWPVGFLAAGTWIGFAFLSRLSSLSALVTAAATPVFFLWFGRFQWMEAFLVISLLVFVRHKDNIIRLYKGEEPRIGASKDT